MLALTDPFAVFSGHGTGVGGAAVDILATEETDTNDSLDVDDRDEGCCDDSDSVDTTMDVIGMSVSSLNPDEISVDDFVENEEIDETREKSVAVAPPVSVAEESSLGVLSLLSSAEKAVSPLSRAFAQVSTSPVAVVYDSGDTSVTLSRAVSAGMGGMEASSEVTGLDPPVTRSSISDSSAPSDCPCAISSVEKPLLHSTPVAKQFKRRNMSQYMSTDD